jgi:uroporphyrinogen-III decarboxylase
MWSDYYSEDNDREAVKSVLLQRGRDAVAAAGFDKLILAPGCGAPQDIPPYRFTLQHEAALQLTREFGRR